ncbi:hypothetical protein AQUCO_02700248v1 [Aquilegia coerulea]|uniref:DUF674 domain-containing protein n=1 Tax=Aquilegia coerulea TaxID=218851 RepID=A0A2G5D6V3_AQUCA|nr:hypothetical protein AQUCO_02700248v1 [Aquilegia coerulea]
MAASKLRLKLVIDKKNNRVVYAEAGKDVVDFLFSLLCLPIGSAVRLLTKSKMVGCFGNLYVSVGNLYNTSYLNSKDFLLNPKVADAPCINVPLLIPSTTAKQFYSCSSGNHHNHFTNKRPVYSSNRYSCARCPVCRDNMSSKITCVPKAPDAIGYVKEVVYMVMDNLTVMPMSTTAIITLLEEFRIDNVKSLDEKVIDFGKEEGLELLRTSWQFENVLSQVFLVKKEK